MEAKKYLQNQFIIENCKVYLEQFTLLSQYKMIVDVVNSLDPLHVTAHQIFNETNNQTRIYFNVASISEEERIRKVNGIELMSTQVPDIILNMDIKITKNKVSSISLLLCSPSVKLNVKIEFLNNKVCKVEKTFKENGLDKKLISYYIDDKLINSILFDVSLKHPKIENKMFVENSYEQGGSYYFESYNERNYIYNTCISRRWQELPKVVSHSQFNKGFEGNLKRVRKFGRMPDESKY